MIRRLLNRSRLYVRLAQLGYAPTGWRYWLHYWLTKGGETVATDAQRQAWLTLGHRVLEVAEFNGWAEDFVVPIWPHRTAAQRAEFADYPPLTVGMVRGLVALLEPAP